MPLTLRQRTPVAPDDAGAGKGAGWTLSAPHLGHNRSLDFNWTFMCTPRRDYVRSTISRSRGQGVVSAAEMSSIAAFLRGKCAQAFPNFGSERVGAPVISFCRVDERPICSREPMQEPDAIVIQALTHK